MVAQDGLGRQRKKLVEEMAMILTGLILFLAVIPLYFMKNAFREANDLPGSIILCLVSVTSLVCYLAGPVFFCVGFFQLIVSSL